MEKTLELTRRILKDGKTYIPFFLFLGVINLAMIPLEIYGLFLSRNLVDQGFLLHDWDVIKGVLYILISIFLIRSFLHYGTALFFEKFRLRINRNFQNRIFYHLLHMPMVYFIKERTGRLMSRVLDDGTRFSMILNTLFGSALFGPLKMIALIFFLAYVNTTMCLIMIFSTCFSIVVFHWTGNRFRLISKEIQAKNAVIYSFIEQVFPNIELIKSKNTEKETARSFHIFVDEFIGLSLKLLKISLISQPVLQALKYLTLGSLFFYGSWLISSDMITMGSLTVFLGGTYLFFNILNLVGNTYGSLRENLARMEVIYDILDSKPEKDEISKTGNAISPVKSLEFRNIVFGYDPEIHVLKSISFKAVKGEIFGITGQSGSGKTTLIRLLVGFFKPDSGEILINGQPLGYYDLHSLRSSIGIAFQDNLIFNDTIKNNITYGNERLTLEQVKKASIAACAHDFIQPLIKGYDSMIVEGGKSLSGGERQRIAIARAIVSDPEILLLDEATSFIEIKQEAEILQSIKILRKDKITVIISHRMSALKAADRILLLDNGRVIESDYEDVSKSLIGCRG